VLEVINRLEQFIDLHGPFDGILGFSQGAALAASYLLHDADRSCPRAEFRCAVFFCAIQCWDVDSPGFTLDKEGHCRAIGAEGNSSELQWKTDEVTSVFSAANHPLLRRDWDEATPLLWPYGKAPMLRMHWPAFRSRHCILSAPKTLIGPTRLHCKHIAPGVMPRWWRQRPDMRSLVIRFWYARLLNSFTQPPV
jgi:hypothetical protein